MVTILVAVHNKKFLLLEDKLNDYTFTHLYKHILQ